MTAILPPGTPLLGGEYVVVAHLGSGAFADVYHVVCPAMGDAPFALKLIRPDAARGVASELMADYEERFRLESALAAKIHDPRMALAGREHVIQVYRVGRDEATGAACAVMELAPGGSLADRLAEGGPVAAAEAVPLMLGMLRGLAAVHAAGAIHRDIKPANILLGAGGVAKIGDLGLAQVAGLHGAGSVGRRSIAGSVGAGHPGTPEYMSPEHRHPEVLLPTSDMYGVGAVMFEVLTGRPWHQGRLQWDSPREAVAELAKAGKWARGAAHEADGELRDDGGDTGADGIAGDEVPAWLDAVVARMLLLTPGQMKGQRADASVRWVLAEDAIGAVEAGLAADAARVDAERARQAEAARQLRAAEEKAERERAEAERLAREQADAERQAREQAEAEKQARERADAERRARESAEAEARARVEAERRAREEADVSARFAAEKRAREQAQAGSEDRTKVAAGQLARERKARREREDDEPGRDGVDRRLRQGRHQEGAIAEYSRIRRLARFRDTQSVARAALKDFQSTYPYFGDPDGLSKLLPDDAGLRIIPWIMVGITALLFLGMWMILDEDRPEGSSGAASHDLVSPTASESVQPKLKVIERPVEYRSIETDDLKPLASGSRLTAIPPGANVVVGESGHARIEWADLLTAELLTGTDILISLSDPVDRHVILDQASGHARYTLHGEHDSMVSIIANWIEVSIDHGFADVLITFVPGVEPTAWVAALSGSAEVRRGDNLVTLDEGQLGAFFESGDIPAPQSIDPARISGWFDDVANGTAQGSILTMLTGTPRPMQPTIVTSTGTAPKNSKRTVRTATRTESGSLAADLGGANNYWTVMLPAGKDVTFNLSQTNSPCLVGPGPNDIGKFGVSLTQNERTNRSVAVGSGGCHQRLIFNSPDGGSATVEVYSYEPGFVVTYSLEMVGVIVEEPAE